ncbi:hypothetical protein T4D_16537 [Trichinella pseudospiralis]|uniref:Uncharacterized protein n=1 Tax=Trichinella pseudospiralis TaxID=6337 RepID=A0A0V1DP30_TRIPS|nr:hypothetical protein T4D_16537 [Trichinella pseudospiralis]
MDMARKLKIMENEKHPLDDFKNDEITKHDMEYGKKLKIMENDKHLLDDLKNDEIAEKR